MGAGKGGLSQVTLGFESWRHNEIAQVGGSGMGRGGLRVCRCRGNQLSYFWPLKCYQAGLTCTILGAPFTLAPGSVSSQPCCLRGRGAEDWADSAPTPPAVPVCFHSELCGRLCQSPSLNAPCGRESLSGLEMLSGCPK